MINKGYHRWAKCHHSLSCCLVVIILVMIVIISPVNLVKAVGRSNAPILLTDLQKDASQWQIFQDNGIVTGFLSKTTSPTLDGNTLKIGLLGGHPYSGLHAYRNLSQLNKNASQFTLVLSFFFPSLAHIQALEFTMNTWINNIRWKWAVQWEHYGDGSAEQGNPPTWRVWAGSHWQNMNLPQTLAPNTWHSLWLGGNIVAGKVHYTFIQSDNLFIPLDLTFDPVSNPGNKMAVGVQLDGDYQERPYHVYIDKMGLFII